MVIVSTRGAEDVELVLAARSGDDRAFGTLFDRWFDRVYDVAWRIVRNRDTAAEVAQEAMLAAWQNLGSLEQPSSFGGWLLRTSRNKALNRLDRERRSVAIGDEETTMEIDRRTAGTDTTGGAVEEAEHTDLVWAAAAALGERDASVLDLHLRHGLGAPELASALGVTTNNAHQLLFRMKGKLGAAVKGWVLWAGGQPACAELGTALVSRAVTRFGPEAVKTIERHAGGCADCSARQESRLSPEAMFAAVPIAVAPALLKAKAAAAMEAAGVPMGGSASVAAVAAAPARPVRTMFVVAAVVAVVALVAVALLADPLGPGTRERAKPVVATTEPVLSRTTTTLPAAGAAVPVVVPETTTTTTTSTTTTTTTTTTTAPPPPAAPTIDSFTATLLRPGPPCMSFQRKIALSWSSTDATTATISGPGTSGPVAPSGALTVCVNPAEPNPAVYTLTVTGSGGTTSGTASAR